MMQRSRLRLNFHINKAPLNLSRSKRFVSDNTPNQSHLPVSQLPRELSASPSVEKSPVRPSSSSLEPIRGERRRRKPTVDEELERLEKRDVRLILLIGVLIFVVKTLYDAYYNYFQIQLYNDPNAADELWKQVGEAVWLEGKAAKVVKNRYGKALKMDGPFSPLEKTQVRLWTTFDYVTSIRLFFLRFRIRIWDDVGTLKVVAPISGSVRKGEFHLVAFTQDKNWVLQKAWLEDEDLIIEIKRRVDMDFISSLNPELLKQIEETKRGETEYR